MSCGSCGCCSPFRPRYKRLVDNIFPDYPEDGLVKGNMDKLLYYAVNSPEKLDSIQWLNMYVEFYLLTVQRVLENTQPEMQVRASESFLYFAQKEEDVPAYHRRYDFFISKFSQMCHSESNDPVVTSSIRISGLKGIGGVVRKIVNEDLAENIWDQRHMDKIIPSLLYNIQIGDYKAGLGRSQTPDLGAISGQETLSPLRIAEDTLRKLLGKASFTSVRQVLKPVLGHLDLHRMWTPADFAEHVFQIIVFSIAQVKCGIATVLSDIFTSRAIDASVGPSVLETINALLTHLRSSVENMSSRLEADPDCRRYNEAILNALGEYSSSLPNFQIIEIMIFILGKVPPRVNLEQTDPRSADVESELQHTMLKALLTVGDKYTPIQFTTTFPPQFLGHLLNMLRSPEPDVRLLVLQIFHTLVDRKGNLDRLNTVTLEPRTDLVIQKPNFNKQDNIFFMKYGERLYSEFLKVLREESNSCEFHQHIWTTCSLLLLECNSDENIGFQIDLIRDIQDLAMSTKNIRLNNANRIALHSICVSLLAMIGFVVKSSDLTEYKDRLVSIRRSIAPHLLPPLEEEYTPDAETSSTPEQVLIDLEVVRNCLRQEGRYIDKVGSRTPSVRNSRQNSPRHSPRNSWMENVNMHNRRPSSVSVNSVNVEVDSAASSPGIIRKPPNTEVSFFAMKKALQEPSARDRDTEERNRRLLREKYLTASFKELCEMTAANKPSGNLQQCVNEVFGRHSYTEISHDTVDITKGKKNQFEEFFPELFMY
ncbi:protein EFR3 homolog cmp44E [Eurytemora carolleeae]|uniref:protein EFR3 homolog cmp44E n=1 Tax=Eurytemora carolleeae TaxID=1294199 RepID=UPI000C75F3DC|nr:protein EFR3 homolog cmp44E [Eurytemora carolleeae]|eukprot:XP_023335599.1 protein EFR3 homolog cmp44E-like [Eurytemora affinis]